MSTPFKQKDLLSFTFRGKDVPVVHNDCIPREVAILAISSAPFVRWAAKISRKFGTKRIDCHLVEIQSVDLSQTKVQMIKIKVDSILVDEDFDFVGESISQAFCLRDNSVSLLVDLVCEEDGESWSVLADKPSMAIGAISALELPTGYIDEEDGDTIMGNLIEDINNACGLKVSLTNTINIGEKAYEQHSIRNKIGVCPSLQTNSEFVKILYLKKHIKKNDLSQMMKKFNKQRDHGQISTLRAIPLKDIWKVSADAKVFSALFLLQMAEPTLDGCSDRRSWNYSQRKHSDSVRLRWSMISDSVRHLKRNSWEKTF